MKIKAQKLAGFRDFLPEEARKREYVLNTIKSVFTSYGFEPVETPAIEYAKTLLGKYGEEADKLIYQFKDCGDRQVGLRYDLTVPLARVIASYPALPMPFKRYQIQPVWRADKPQAGRYREFLQCDIDIVGVNSLLADAEIIACALSVVRSLKLKNTLLFINDRSVFAGIEPKYIAAIDKLEKIGRENVLKELEIKGLTKQEAESLFKKIENTEITPDLQKVFEYFKPFLEEGLTIEYRPTLARGLDYYTGVIFELLVQGEGGNSIGGGGRYDELIGKFTGRNLPAVGFSFGIDRLIETMEQQGLFKNLPATPTKVLVTVFSPEFLSKSLETTLLLRSNRMNCETYPDPQTKLDKQLKYADKKEIEWVVIIGPDEVENKTVTIKNMQTGEQKTVPETSLVALITQGV